MEKTKTSKEVKPYQDKEGAKKEQVAEMFDNISHKYDFLNHFLSLNIDKLWRKKAIRLIKKDQPKQLLDIATGTGDFALAALKINPDHVTGVDISNGMLDIGKQKMIKKKVDDRITLTYGDSENLQFKDGQFHAVTVGFGVRNFENLEKGLQEIHRVLDKNGKAVILEFSKPKKFPIKQLFGFYSKRILPFFGRLFSKDKRAYTYLPESVEAFPEGEDFKAILQKVGFSNISLHPVSGGIASIYIGTK